VLTVNEALLGEEEPEEAPDVTWTNLLVPIDFTEADRLVLRYAASLAHEAKGRIILFHACRKELSRRSRAPINLHQAENELRQLLEQNLEVVAQQEIPSDIKVEKVIQAGRNKIRTAAETAKQLGSDLILAAVHRKTWWAPFSRRGPAEPIVRTAVLC
jgi:nucleotide-binding universal stress UspA family protein